MADASLQRARMLLDRSQSLLGGVLGRQTVDLLIERAALEASIAHRRLAGLRLTNGRLELDALGDAFDGATDEEVESAFDALLAVLFLLLRRLVGRQFTATISDQLTTITVPQNFARGVTRGA